MSKIVPFPNARGPVPEDAKPIGRERDIFVFPGANGWDVHEQDDGGGSVLGAGLTKAKAIEIGLEQVMKFNAEMRISND